MVSLRDLPHSPSIIVMMGPAGAGKTTVGLALAGALGWRFADADDFHDAHNRARLSRGESLTDAERAPWLAALRAEIGGALGRGERLVLACSALRQRYRDALVPADAPPGAVRFAYLRVPARELAERLATRPGHFAPPAILPGQLATLEEPEDEEALWLDGERSPAQLVADIRAALGV